MTDETLSAQVVMRAASGERVPGNAVTAETIGSYVPDPVAVGVVRDYLARAGFAVSDVIGISFSISAPRSTFELFFGRPLRVQEREGITTVDTGQGLELPLDAMPAEVRRHVDAVTFTPPPDFGPTDYWNE